MAQMNPSKVTQKEQVTVTVPYKQTSYAQQQKRVERIKTKAEILNSILVKNHPNEGLKYIVIPEDTNVKFIANKFKISESKLMKWNELESEVLQKNDIIFLESKNSAGNTATYKAESGEDMHQQRKTFFEKVKDAFGV